MRYNRFTPAYRCRTDSRYRPGRQLSGAERRADPAGDHHFRAGLTLGNGSSINAQLANEDYQFKDIMQLESRPALHEGRFRTLRKRYLNRSYFQTMGVFNFTGGLPATPPADFLIGKPATANVAMPLTEQGGVQTQLQPVHSGRLARHPTPDPESGTALRAAAAVGASAEFLGDVPSRPAIDGVPERSAGHGVSTAIRTCRAEWFRPTRTTSRRGSASPGMSSAMAGLRYGAAFGIFYDRDRGDIIQNFSQPFRYTFTYNSPYSLSDPLRGQAPLPLTTNMQGIRSSSGCRP